MNEPVRVANSNDFSLKQEISNLNKNLRKLNSYNRKRNVIMRGLLNGIFTAIGATLGFALFLIIFSRILHGAERIPFLDELIEKTKLNQIIESNLPIISKPSVVPTVTSRPSVTPKPLPTSTVAPTSTPKLTPTPTDSVI
jgi:hypothetical protein